MELLFVMLIWAGDWRGGPATINGFSSLEACQKAKPTVISQYAEMTGMDASHIRTRCVSLPSK